MSDTKSLNQTFEQILKHYLGSCKRVRNIPQSRNVNPELEVRFGTNTNVAKPISTVDYQNVVNNLKANGWTSSAIEGMQMLRIIPERLETDFKVPERKEMAEQKEMVEQKEMAEQKEMVAENAAAVAAATVPVSDAKSDEPSPELDASSSPFELENEYDGGAAVAGAAVAGAGRKKKRVMSNIRAEIEGTRNIQDYCQHNDIQRFDKYNTVRFTKKQRPTNPDTGKPFDMVNYEDFNFRVAYMEEESYRINSNYMPIKKILYDWPSTQKTYRCINRVRFAHPKYPVFVDISVVKTNKKNVKKNGKLGSPIPTNTIQESEVFRMTPIFEIELEIDNSRMQYYPETSDGVSQLLTEIRQCIRFVLAGLQETPYPTPYSEQDAVLEAYMCRMYSDSWMSNKTPKPFFMGPQSVALQLEQMVEHDAATSNHISILQDYCVTEKADGIRALLYVSSKGKIYMISSNLKVMFTGSITKEKNCFDSLLDGEFIMYGKAPLRKQLFLYAAFDIYYFGGMQKNAHVRPLPFSTVDETALEDHYRLSLLKKFHALCKLEPVSANAECVFQFRCKHFEHYIESSQTIVQASRSVWSNTYDYETDGLIYTPMGAGVGGTKPGEANELNGRKFTWASSFKWKPPHYNTIDFLVQVQKDKDGQDLIRYVAHDGDNVMPKVIPYKTLILHVGFDKKKHRHMNAFHDVLYDNDEYFTHLVGSENESSYEAMPFVPTVPYDPESYLCHIELDKTTAEKLQMRTLEGDVFQEDMIVEFQYMKDNTKKQGPWKWVPLRVRQDKTQALREGQKSMNNYTTANTTWRSIHFPVTESMVLGKEPIPKVEVEDAVYYTLVEKSNTSTRGLRDFHNVVKRKLIESVSKYLRKNMKVAEPLLIDYAVGKSGDLHKWSGAKIRFVLGIDIHGDGITNPHDGACVRYLKWRHNNQKHPLRALFLEGNCGLNIRTEGNAFKSTLDKEVVQSIFGHGKNTNAKKYVFTHGMAKEGFHISSCQFALHYFFENHKTLHNFLKNLAECTRLHGYFIGTCFDGQEVFKFLHKRENGSYIRQNESVRMDVNGRKIFEITKKYDSMVQEFRPDETSVGMPIMVYQESIGKQFLEYLVHFDYLTRLLENYGFVLVEKDELRGMGFTEASGLFKRMYGKMKKGLDKNGADEAQEEGDDYAYFTEITAFEKKISFLNRYFIFKKVRELSQVSLNQMEKSLADEKAEAEAEADAEAEELENQKEDEKEISEKEISEKQVDDLGILDENAPVMKLQPKVATAAAKPKPNATRKAKKLKLPKIEFTDANYSPIDVEFPDDPNLQAFYETLNDKNKQKILNLPVRDRKLVIQRLWKKKQPAQATATKPTPT